MSINIQFMHAIHHLLQTWENELQEIETNMHAVPPDESITEASPKKLHEVRLRVERLQQFIKEHNIQKVD